MLAGALRNAILESEDITRLLGEYQFDPNGALEPSIFTADPLPSDGMQPGDVNDKAMLPALVITETVGQGLDGQRGRNAAEFNAEVKIVGQQSHAQERFRRIAAKIWDFIDKSCNLTDPEEEFEIIGAFAEPPQDLGVDDEGYPQFRVRVIATVYGPEKQEA